MRPRPCQQPPVDGVADSTVAGVLSALVMAQNRLPVGEMATANSHRLHFDSSVPQQF